MIHVILGRELSDRYGRAIRDAGDSVERLLRSCGTFDAGPVKELEIWTVVEPPIWPRLSIDGRTRDGKVEVYVRDDPRVFGSLDHPGLVAWFECRYLEAARVVARQNGLPDDAIPIRTAPRPDPEWQTSTEGIEVAKATAEMEESLRRSLDAAARNVVMYHLRRQPAKFAWLRVRKRELLEVAGTAGEEGACTSSKLASEKLAREALDARRAELAAAGFVVMPGEDYIPATIAWPVGTSLEAALDRRYSLAEKLDQALRTRGLGYCSGSAFVDCRTAVVECELAPIPRAAETAKALFRSLAAAQGVQLD